MCDHRTRVLAVIGFIGTPAAERPAAARDLAAVDDLVAAVRAGRPRGWIAEDRADVIDEGDVYWTVSDRDASAAARAAFIRAF